MENEKYYYTCQCTEGYGYENCTKADESAGSVSFGHTYCEVNPKKITLTPADENLPLIFIDHAAYGRPLEPPSITSFKCRNYYAKNEDEVSQCFIGFFAARNA